MNWKNFNKKKHTQNNSEFLKQHGGHVVTTAVAVTKTAVAVTVVNVAAANVAPALTINVCIFLYCCCFFVLCTIFPSSSSSLFNAVVFRLSYFCFVCTLTVLYL